MNIIHRSSRFILIGFISTAIAYAVLMTLLATGVHYSIAVLGSWPPAVFAGFVLNRRITFGIKEDEGRTRHFAWYVIGALLQLGLAVIAFGYFTKHVGLNPSVAFLANLILTTAFSFAFLNVVTFRR